MAPPKKPWFRLYVETFGDRKIRRLSYPDRWLFTAVLGAARQSPIAGRLMLTENEPMTMEDLADFACMKLAEVRSGVKRLAGLGIVALDGDIVFVPQWADRQFESDDVAKRTAKHRAKERPMERSNDVPGNVGRNSDVTHQSQSQKTDISSSRLSTHVVPVENPSDDDNEFEWSAVWDSFADAKARLDADGTPKPDRWRATVRRNAEAEQSERARDLLAQFDLAPHELGEVLAGVRDLRYLTRRETA